MAPMKGRSAEVVYMLERLDWKDVCGFQEVMRNKNDEKEGEKLQIVLEMIRGGLNGVGIAVKEALLKVVVRVNRVSNEKFGA